MTDEKKKGYLKKEPPKKINTVVQTMFACKWSLTVYHLLEKGINRPGEMVRSVEGLSAKVLNDCLRKNMEYGILHKEVFQELPPRVEYSLTPFGSRFLKVLEEINKLNEELEGVE